MSIFKAYDIRGVYGTELTLDIAEKIGRAAVKYTGAKNIVVGYDSRTSNLKLFSALAKGLINSGANVMHIGIVTKPLLNWITIKERYDLGIMITASHNPKEYNGFNLLWKGKTIHYEKGLKEIEAMLEGKFKNAKKKGRIQSRDYIEEYVNFISSKLDKTKKRARIVGDASNGASGEILKRFMEKNNLDCELIFTEPDGRFPCHDPNPLYDNSLAVLRRKVIEKKADFGFIVDPDADRGRFVDEKGEIANNT